MIVSGESFLSHVLPDEGYKCATVLTGKRRYNQFFDSISALAAFVAARDAQGETVYHACAAFKVPQSDPRETPRNQRTMGRTAHNAACAQSLWLDVDAGPSKAYTTAAAAYVALVSFCARIGLPAPTVVGSGSGLHAYFALVEPALPGTWLAYATCLKQLAAREGFHCDPARTSDISSILRTPGTHNRKHGAVEVWCTGLEGPYELSELGEVHAAVSTLQPIASHTSPPRLPQAATLSVADAAANIYANEPGDPDAIAQGCRQLGLLKQHAGQIPEPAWYAGISVLAHAGSFEAAHEWSAGHPNYTTSETDDRLDRALQFGPTTCKHFEKINPHGCAGCLHYGKITSPIQLGRNTAPVQSLAPSSSSGHGHTAKPADLQCLPPQFPSAPFGFTINAHGLLFQTETQGKPSTEVVSRHPLYLDAIQTGEITPDSFSLCFKHHLPQEEVKTIVIPAKTFFSSQGMSEMSGRGAVIHDHDLFRKYTREAMDMWHHQNRLQMRYDQFGWKSDEAAFLYGTRLYSAASIDDVAGADELRTRSQYLGPTKHGSLAKWSAAANTLFAQGCEPHSFALLCSFAAPLMRFHAGGEGGAIVSLVSDQSGSGKTTALEAAASVWGRLRGTQLTDDDTRVSKGLTLGVLGNLPCIYDELHNRDPEMIRQFVMMFTNGRDKQRGTSDGRLIYSKAEWQTILINASNLSLVDTLSSMEGTDAPAFRVLEFVAALPAGLESKGDELRRVLDANSGHAGDAYLKVLLQPATLSYIKQAMPEWTAELWKRTGLRPEHRFWVRTLASVIAAGVLVRHAGILDFSMQRITDWATAVLCERSGDNTITGSRTASSILSEYFHANINNMLVMPMAWRPKTLVRPLLEPKKELLIRIEMHEGKAYVLENDLRRYLVKRGVNRSAFMQELLARHVILNKFKRVTLGAGSDFASGQITAVEINMNHPALSGTVVEVENILPKGPQNTRAERIAAVTDEVQNRR